MNNIAVIFEELFSISLDSVVKVLFLITLVIYDIFAFIITRQVKLKRQTVETALGIILEIASYIHLIACILLTLFTLLV